MKNKRKVFFLTLIVTAAYMLSGCSFRKKEYDSISVSFLKVGKADAIVIRTAESTVLIDSANSGEGKDIYKFCSDSGSDMLDYFILTHFDQDHVGGAKAVISKFSDVKNILEPDYTETSDEYLKYEKAVSEKGYITKKVKKELKFELDGAVFTVYPALEDSYENTNDYSLVITMKYGEKNFLFTGDAENKRLKEIMQQLPNIKNGYDIIKIPHHGEVEKKSEEFIGYVRPSAAVICCSKKEPADEELIKILEKNEVDIYYTYNGTVTFTCDGYSIVVGEQSV